MTDFKGSNFKVDTSDYLGFKYEQYRDDLYALALAKPSEYFKLRKVVIDKVKTQAIGNIYKSFYNILSQGTDAGDQPIIIIDEKPVAPSFPAQEVSKMALKAARTLDDILNEVINVILPSDFKQLANSRAVQKSEQKI